MPNSLESLGWDRFSPDEKLALVNQLWDTLVAHSTAGGASQ